MVKASEDPILKQSKDNSKKRRKATDKDKNGEDNINYNDINKGLRNTMKVIGS